VYEKKKFTIPDLEINLDDSQPAVVISPDELKAANGLDRGHFIYVFLLQHLCLERHLTKISQLF
jgi:hypothetical protein